MHQARRLGLLAKPAASRGVSVGRHVSTKTQQNRKVTKDDVSDFRPPWVYLSSRFLTYTTIPLALLYCAFLADWGEREHVFMPLRRWASKYKQPVVSLSPEETALVQGNVKQTPSSSLLPSEEDS